MNKKQRGVDIPTGNLIEEYEAEFEDGVTRKLNQLFMVHNNQNETWKILEAKVDE